MKSINPDDFRVIDKIKLSKTPTELSIDANIDLYKEQLKG